MKKNKIKKKLLSGIQHANNVIVLLDSIDDNDRHKINDIIINIFEMVDNFSDAEIDLYNLLKGR